MGTRIATRPFSFLAQVDDTLDAGWDALHRRADRTVALARVRALHPFVTASAVAASLAIAVVARSAVGRALAVAALVGVGAYVERARLRDLAASVATRGRGKRVTSDVVASNERLRSVPDHRAR